VSVFFALLALGLLWVGLRSYRDRETRRQEAVDTLTQRQRDSLLSTMPVPGAGAVGKALDAADKARERARQLDTMGD
jgi:hypothetical protein